MESNEKVYEGKYPKYIILLSIIRRKSSIALVECGGMNTMINSFLLSSNGLNTEIGFNVISNLSKYARREIDNIMIITAKYNLKDIIRENCYRLKIKTVYFSDDFERGEQRPDVDAVYVTEGNLDRVYRYCLKYNFDKYILKQVEQNNALYIGASAGACLSSDILNIAFSLEKIECESLITGLGLFRGDILPHTTYSEKERFMTYLSKEERYEREILNIADGEGLLVNVEDSVIINKKRGRVSY